MICRFEDLVKIAERRFDRDLRIAGKAVPQAVQIASLDLAITPKRFVR